MGSAIIVGGCKPATHNLPAPREYRARNPLKNPLSRLVLDNLLEFEAWLKEAPAGKPRPHPSVINSLEKFTECGVLRYGAVRYRCPECGHNVFVAFSCKRRGLCPSCDAKRSAVVVAAALDRLLPPARYRQWVLVIPKRLRYFVNARPDLAGYLSKLLAHEINRYLKQKAAGAPAQLHFVQRFGGALNLHVHIHAVVSDGTFILETNALGLHRLLFRPVDGPDDKELDKIVQAIRRKLLRRLCRLGCLPPEAAEEMLNWENSGFSLHKEVVIYPRNRQGLERLLGYCSRPALSLKRLIYASKSKIVLYRSEQHDGRPEMMTMSPVEFLRRWGLLRPPPHKNLVHYYGALAPRSPLRAALTEQAGKEVERIKAAERTEKLKNKARSWAACLARVFEVFPLICPKCRIALKPVAVILNDKELVRLLTHFDLPTEFPVFRPAPAQYAAKRGPPEEDCQLNPLADQYDAIDPPAPED
ncbi:MAG: transposase [Elusimicrobiales bacterium]|nr:transposase [Elusimicrobiales bacterium]